MRTKTFFLCLYLTLHSIPVLYSQISDSVIRISGSIHDSQGNPLPYTHVINLITKSGTTADSSGIFKIKAKHADVLYFNNLAFIDTSVVINKNQNYLEIKLSRRKYAIPEVKIFEWGSTYEDFKQALLKMPLKKTVAEKLKLPQQDPNLIPYYLDSDLISSARFLYNSPIDFLYLNLNKTEISRRKVYDLIKNKEQIEKFNKIYSHTNISGITGLKDKELLEFMVYLESRFECDYRCSEIQITKELFMHWNHYKKYMLHPK